jgi:2-hydroxychromene-2-carboxylate isomerase
VTPPVEFHFDFGSPAAYLSHRVIPAIGARTEARFVYVPVLLVGVFKATSDGFESYRNINVCRHRFVVDCRRETVIGGIGAALCENEFTGMVGVRDCRPRRPISGHAGGGGHENLATVGHRAQSLLARANTLSALDQFTAAMMVET